MSIIDDVNRTQQADAHFSEVSPLNPPLVRLSGFLGISCRVRRFQSISLIKAQIGKYLGDEDETQATPGSEHATG